jgi:hypothetical protein
MTRREEIVNNIGYQTIKAAMEYYQANCTKDVDLSDAFEAGAEWMQETMIEKIRIWVTERYDLDFMGDFKDLLDYIKSL